LFPTTSTRGWAPRLGLPSPFSEFTCFDAAWLDIIIRTDTIIMARWVTSMIINIRTSTPIITLLPATPIHMRILTSNIMTTRMLPSTRITRKPHFLTAS
jgi:hypothetical protein